MVMLKLLKFLFNLAGDLHIAGTDNDCLQVCVADAFMDNDCLQAIIIAGNFISRLPQDSLD